MPCDFWENWNHVVCQFATPGKIFLVDVNTHRLEKNKEDLPAQKTQYINIYICRNVR